MRRLCLVLLALALVSAAGSTDARKFLRGGHGGATACTLEAVALSNSTFPSGSAAGTVVGAVSVTTSGTCGTPSLAISDETNFSLSAATAPANLLTDAASTGGPWSFNVTATLAGANGSPKVLPVTITATGGGSIVTSFNLVNTTGSAVNTVLSPVLGLQFKKGDIPSGQWPAFSRDDDDQACVYSQGFKRTWSDGSLKHLSVVVRCPGSIAGSATLQVNVAGGGSQPTASARTTTELSNASILTEGEGQINLSGTWTATLSDGIATAKKWLDGEAGAGWVVDVDFKQSGAAHGQLRERFYTLLTTDGSGNLGGIRFLPRTWQPFYDVNSPAKNWRGFSALSIKHGAGPTTINPPWPYVASTFTRTASNSFSAPSANYYTGSKGNTQIGSVPVTLSTTGTLPAGLNANQIYWARQANTGTTISLWTGSGTSYGASTTDAGTGTHTMTPIRTVLHFGSYFKATTDAKWNYIQAGGSLATDPPLRATREKTYWHSTKTIPPWDLSVAVADNAAWSYDWNPVNTGTLSLGLQDTGDRDDIGPATMYHTRAFFNQTAANDKLIRAIGLAGAHMGQGSRHSTTGAVPNLGGQSYTGFGPDVSATYRWRPSSQISSGMGSGGGPPTLNQSMGFIGADWSHMPATAWPAFLQTGSPEFFDLMVELANGALGIFAIADRNPTLPAPGAIGIVTGYAAQAREGAWALRDLVAAAGLAPDAAYDSVDYKTYFGDRASAGFTWMLTTTTNTNSYYSTNGLFMPRNFSTGISKLLSPWEWNYYLMAVNFGAGLLENADAVSALNNASKWWDHLIDTFGAYNLRKYQQILTNDSFTTPISSDTQWAGYDITGFTWTSGTPGTVTITTGKATPTNGDKYIFTSGAMGHTFTPPGGTSLQTPYYLVNCNGSQPGTCNLATSPGGAAIALTNSGGGGDLVGIGNVETGGNSTMIANGGLSAAAGSYGAAQWAKANGADQNSGMTNVATDQLTRMQANSWNPVTDPAMKFYMSASY